MIEQGPEYRRGPVLLTAIFFNEVYVDINLILQVAAAAFGLGGQYFVNQRKVKGFYLWLVSNAALITFQVMHGFWVFVGLHTVYFMMALQGIYAWRKEAASAEAARLSGIPSAA
jgi:nicotinamide riboside transporter PnuC